MSLAQLKANSKSFFKKLSEKMDQENNKNNNFKDTRFWEPEIDKTGNGYAIIRFLPAVEGKEYPLVKTFSHGFKVNGKWFIENCPTTIGIQECPVCEANKVLWDSKIPENQEIVRKRKRKIRYISNILVISDPKRPENEGKVFLFGYGTKIYNKIKGAIKPEFEDEKSFDPFDFWEGAPFKLKIRNFEGFRNYDRSEFGDCEPIFKDDETIEKLWKSEYDLDEFLDPKNFKSYADLKNRFSLIVNSSRNAKPSEEDEEEESMEFNGSRNIRQEPETKPKKPKADNTKSNVEDDDDFQLFSQLIDD